MASNVDRWKVGRISRHASAKWHRKYWNNFPGDPMKRSLTEIEKSIIRQIAERLPFNKQHQLLDDLSRSQAEPVTPDGARIVFHISGYQRPPYRGQHSFGVEGELQDKDGAKLSLDLFADENDRLLELELIRWGEGDLIEPDWRTLKFY
jgi:hypothetical protein